MKNYNDEYKEPVVFILMNASKELFCKLGVALQV